MTRWFGAREVGMSCEECYYSTGDSDKHGEENWLLCCYNPPVPIQDPFANEDTRFFRSAFVRVNEWDWCGKWEPKDEDLKDWPNPNNEMEEEKNV